MRDLLLLVQLLGSMVKMILNVFDKKVLLVTKIVIFTKHCVLVAKMITLKVNPRLKRKSPSWVAQLTSQKCS